MTGFRSRKNVVVSKETTMSDYQNLVNAEAKRKRDLFRQAAELNADLNLIINFNNNNGFVEFAISFKDEKGTVIDTIFAKGKMPSGLADSRCYADLLQTAKIESQAISADRVRTFTAVKLNAK
jgi:hypothetical protein